MSACASCHEARCICGVVPFIADQPVREATFREVLVKDLAAALLSDFSFVRSVLRVGKVDTDETLIAKTAEAHADAIIRRLALHRAYYGKEPS